MRADSRTRFLESITKDTVLKCPGKKNCATYQNGLIVCGGASVWTLPCNRPQKTRKGQYCTFGVRFDTVDPEKKKKAQKIAKLILDDATDRKGWRQEYNQFDDTVKKEIMQTWTKIIARAL